jgi:hypothetical protein
MAWNGKSQFCPDWSGLEWRKSGLACLEWPGMEEVSFSLTGIAWKGGSAGFDLRGRAWNEEVGFGLNGMAWKGESHFCPQIAHKLEACAGQCVWETCTMEK